MLQSEVFVVEFSSYSARYTVQRDKILDLIGKKNFTSLGYYNSEDYDQEKGRLLDVIKSFNPDIVHFNEVPENFEYKGFSLKLLQEIYKQERNYKILETCHDNSFDFSRKEVWPDAFVAVSEFQKINLESLGKTCYLWDYEIQKKERPDRGEALRALGLDPNKKHILNIGLFHANKNQKYIYDMASKLIDLVGLSIEFHFVGNECFKDSCGISNLDLPNCRIWGERNDVEAFYSCMDLFLFPSIRELNPLSVKEALSWGMPVIMNKIEACDLYKKYENNPSVKFIQDIDVEREITSLVESVEEKKKVLVKFDSRSLGDSLAWIPYVEEFRKQNDYDVYCFTFNNDLYKKTYPQIKFLSDPEECHGFDNVYDIGWFQNTPSEVKRKSLQCTASHYLNLEHREIKPKIYIENKEKVIEGKYVCIATQSTAQAKYWNNPKGWEQTIKYLNDLGYSVVCIDKHSFFGKDKKMNSIPEGVIDKTGDLPLQERITDIYNCEFFIGLSSGLSWVAWALGKEVILISGFTKPDNEFNTPYRVINKDVCNSCWNEEEFDRANWNWCPYHEGTEREFECSKEITFEMVMQKIDTVRFKNLTDKEGFRGAFKEVFEKNTYHKHVSVEDGDYVVDLGCSLGHTYFKNKHKNIRYVGVDGVKENLDNFSSLLALSDKAVLINRHVSEKYKGLVKVKNNSFCSGKDTESEAISFREILELKAIHYPLNDRKIDFLKFDIEGAEVKIFNNNETYELFIKSVSKFAGELHKLGGNKERHDPNCIKVLTKLKDDKRVDLKIHSVDGVDITKGFWVGVKENRHNYYKEVIISGKIS